MAVNVDNVYQKVLAIANKEQRGYITPQEFNLLANLAQLEIFESYFYEEDRLRKLHGNSKYISDRLEIVNWKLKKGKFYQYGIALTGVSLPSNLYRLDTLYYRGNPAERVEVNEYQNLTRTATYGQPIFVQGRLTTPTLDHPIWIHQNDNKVKCFAPTSVTTSLTCDYIRKPKDAVWGYVVTNEKALYNVTSSTNFELHGSEETELVYRILELSGITIAKPGLAQLADKAEKEMTQPKKQ